MKSSQTRAILYGALFVLYLLHNDLWLWRDDRWLLGLPIGLTYHVLYCLVTAALMAALVRWAWPSELAASTESSTDRASTQG